MHRARTACLLIPLLLAACVEDDPQYAVDVEAFESGPSTATIRIVNLGERDLNFSACEMGVYTQVERWNGSAWIRLDDSCEPLSNTGFGLTQGGDMEYSIVVPQSGRYRFGIQTVRGDPGNPTFEIVRSNALDL